MTGKPEKKINLTPDDRRRDMADRLYHAAFRISNTKLAEIYGVSNSTITEDRRSDAYWEMMDSLGDNRMYELQHKAWEVIRDAIDGGDKGIAMELLKNTDRRFVRQVRDVTDIKPPSETIGDELDEILNKAERYVDVIIETDAKPGNGHRGNGNGETPSNGESIPPTD